MTSPKRDILLGVLVVGCVSLFTHAAAQDMFGITAPTSALDELSAMPTGAGGRFAPPSTALPPPGASAGFGAAPGGSEAVFNPFVTEPKKKFKVIAGRRVYCKIHGTDTLLEDPRELNVEESLAKTLYYDDGTHGDELADDGVFTKIEVITGEYLSAGANELRRRILSLVIQAERRAPIDFFLLHAVTIEPVSQVANEVRLEAERDGKVGEWANKFLQQYRIDPGDPTSEFLPLYLPPPPPMPEAPFPAGFNPVAGPGGTLTPAEQISASLPTVGEETSGPSGYYNESVFDRGPSITEADYQASTRRAREEESRR